MQRPGAHPPKPRHQPAFQRAFIVFEAVIDEHGGIMVQYAHLTMVFLTWSPWATCSFLEVLSLVSDALSIADFVCRSEA